VGIELRTGTFETTLDDKGRISVPAKLRDIYQGELVITWGNQPSAWVMTPEVWAKVEAKLKNSEAITEDEQFLIEYSTITPAQVVEVDRAGRIAIPQTVRRYAKLSKDCLVLSAENRLEIWDAEFFYSYLEENRAALQEARKKMGNRNLFRLD